MRRYQFRCKTCSTFVSIETELPEDQINHIPPCPCESIEDKKETLWDA
jgi:hypothetical protein